LPTSQDQPVETVSIGSVAHGSGFMFRVELTNEGAGILGVQLADHFVTVEDKQLYASNPDNYETARLKDPDKYKGHYTLLTPVAAGSDRLVPLATRRLWVRIVGRTDANGQPVEIRLASLHRKRWALTETTPTHATFTYTLRYDGQDVLRVHKTFHVEQENYTIGVSCRLENLSDEPLQVLTGAIGPTWLQREGVRADNRFIAYGRIVGKDRLVQVKLDKAGTIDKKLKARSEAPVDKRRPIPGTSDEADPVVWVGATNKYFATLLHLKSQTDDRLDAPKWAANFNVEANRREDGSPAYITSVQIGAERNKAGVDVWGVALAPRSTRRITLDLFAGPKDRGIFSNEKDPLFRQSYEQLGYLDTIDFGGCFITSAWLAFRVMWLLKMLSHVTLGNYGLAIFALVFIVRLLLHPLTKKSQVSMLKMQKINPQMQKLKEKYADDKDTLNKEMMKLYREQGATPLLGCLPMFLQMPIWIALYTGISASIDLRHAGLLPVWITDLAAPDALISWSTPVFLIGTSFNLLPILLTVAMFFQTKFSPQMSQAAADDKAKQQQKMMRYLMPGMMLVFFYAAPSGLTLYIMASTAAGLLDSYLVRRHIRMKEAEEAARETTISMPGKRSRSSRPKKPKGPNWVKGG